ncbi:MAG: alpha/beta hydrolase domain-containing protein [Acidimicrobiales bacterium]
MLSSLTGERRPFVAGTTFDLASVGYMGAEYALTGTASAYSPSGTGLIPIEVAGFVTRILVYRPLDESAFNGTVWVEWLNVSGGLDAAPGWIFTHTELIRSGAAWVGVSAQKTGVEGGASLLGLQSAGLVGTDPERYGGLHHPGDRFSYDIYTAATSAVRNGEGTVLDGLGVERVLAMGDSQSAFRLTTYVNDFDPGARVHDGFLVHARGGGAAPLDDESDPGEALRGKPVEFRPDLRVPVLCVEAETDLMSLGYLAARQADTEMLTTWEMAGTSHADVYTFVAGPIDNGHLPIDELAKAWTPVSEIFGMRLDRLVNAGPQHYVRNAAVHHLERWARGGQRPPAAERLQVRDGAFVEDDDGNVLGGVRTPHVDAPTSVLSGLGNGGHPISFLCGSTVPFDADRLRAIYGSKKAYLERFDAATDKAVEAGLVLAADAPELKAVAEANSPL